VGESRIAAPGEDFEAGGTGSQTLRKRCAKDGAGNGKKVQQREEDKAIPNDG